MNTTTINEVHQLTRKEIRAAASTITEREVRTLVKEYYRMQDNRKRGDSQTASLEKNEHVPPESNVLVSFLAAQAEYAENMLKKALDDYTKVHPLGEWMRDIRGIGPITSAGLLANIDITRCPTVGHIWSYAGYNPDSKWIPKEKRPYNANLKKICWHIGQGFMKTSGHEDSVYGKLYLERKQYEINRNETGYNRKLALELVKKFGKATDAYKHLSEGKLPPAHLDARARRWTVKIFLSHLHQVWYKAYYGVDAPKPFAIAILGHAHEIKPTYDHINGELPCRLNHSLSETISKPSSAV